MSLAKLVMLKNIMLDKLIGCRTAERGGYYVRNNELWRETEYYCDRCGKFFFRSQRRLSSSEFWEDDSLYVMPATEKDSTADI